MAVIGLDIGTTGVKSTVLDSQANILSHVYCEYDLIGCAKGRYELDPEVLLQKAREVIAESAKGIDGGVQAISITSFAESFVCLDANDKVLGNTMIYMDPRGEEECAEYLVEHDDIDSFSHTGQSVSPMFAVYKLRWLWKHHPEMIHRTRRICFIADFVAYMLGAAHQCDYSLAARSAMFDIFEKHWMPDAIAFSKLNPEALPEAVPAGSIVGEVSAVEAEKLGLKCRSKLILGGHDQVMAALGSGAWEAGDIANGMGTVDCLTPIVTREVLDLPKLLQYKIAITPYLNTDRYVIFPFNMSGGCAVKWFRDTLAKDLCDRKDAYEVLNEEAAQHPTKLLVLPYVGGAGTPTMDAQTPCTIYGLRIGTSRGDIFRSFLEGESYEMRRNLDCMREIGIDARKIVAVGGGTKSTLWMQIRADIFGISIFLPINKEAGTLASAMLCYTALGEYEDVHAAQQNMVQYECKFTPESRNMDFYTKQYHRYLKLYESLQSVWEPDLCRKDLLA